MKKIIALLLVLTMGLSLTACGGNKDDSNDTPNDSQKSTSKKDEKIEIRLLTRMAGTSTQVGIFKDIIKEFEAKHSDVVVVDESQGDESSFNNKLKADIASGTLPNIFRIQGVANLGDYIENGLIMNMDSALEADPEWSQGFTEGALKYYQVPGYEGTYAIPMESGLIGVFYNEALFKKANIDKFPETWSELKSAIEKLNAINVTPIALGAKTTYMAGHLHDQIFYKWMGTDAAKELGARNLKWTDEDVVETLGFVKELYDLKAFPEGVAGISDDIVLTQFLKGEAAMIITGPWNIGKLTNPEETEFVNDIKVAKFPYFDEKPEFKDQDMQIVSPYMVNGKLEGKEKEYTIELLKMLTSADAAKRYAEEAQFIVPRKDIDIDESKVSTLFTDVLKLSGTSAGMAVDVFDYDPLASMQDRTRNSIVGMFVGNTPEQAAQEIQSEIDK
ncbi:ABC transporter substrate-binding protein [Vallitalea maricola]|uniref:ABC transporter substrate-binding protein n=1 Tax=Vallitalea maricola TaxID=3074433 RepID=A0ACB5UQC3_9FIRM|nr:ABC transporter substrate-binding protein [Vallitalea sp. AN17-2]